MTWDALIEKFLHFIAVIKSLNPAYKQPGDGSKGVCDCIGLIIGAIQRMGLKWKGIHGSNYWARFNTVNLSYIAQESDLKKMMAAAASNRRVTLDLDETVFRPESDPCLEKRLRFPLNRFYKERLRLGIPALFHMLNASGYDIWIYTASYYSVNYLQYYLKHYRVHVTGIVTGTARKGPAGTDTRKALETMLESRYKSTVHIDKDSVIRTFTGSHSFEEFSLSGAPETWSREVMDVFEKMKKNG